METGLMPSAGLCRGLWDGCLAVAGAFCRPCNGSGLLAPGVDFMAGGGSLGGCVWQKAGGDFLGVWGVVVGVFVAPDPSGKGTYQDLSLKMIRKTRRIGRLTPSAGHQWLHGGSRNRYPAGRSTFRFARDSSN